jgi:hypothetical protein
MKIKRTGDVEQERLKNSDKGLKKKVNWNKLEYKIKSVFLHLWMRPERKNLLIIFMIIIGR